ncbi:retinol dehydrogenase 14-like [Limulus polyphemus]|uniref:Retinol dehydrogenase 14-like n=1 Tax=Limulus polyphemus TaxID=6850 RepID=A0ABM1B988_LIMPO|nr:retinol dehydrogenase 14-like [Limulus polyphemus]
MVKFMEFASSNSIFGDVYFGISFVVLGTVLMGSLWYMYRTKSCPKQWRADGKTILITGGNTGIGKWTALELAKRVIARTETVSGEEEGGGKTARRLLIPVIAISVTRGEEAAEFICSKVPCALVTVMKMDLSSLNSVRHFVKEFKAKYDKLDILINNAGVALVPLTRSEDGYELHFAVNHLGHFLLTCLLLDQLKASTEGARIVVVSALAHKFVSINLKEINSEEGYVSWKAYSRSKLANILFARELTKLLKGSNVTVNSLHPGIVETDLLRHLVVYKVFRYCAWPFIKFFLKTPREGAQTSVYVAVSPDLAGVSGKYFSDCDEASVSKEAEDDHLAQALWKMSVEMTGL